MLVIFDRGRGHDAHHDLSRARQILLEIMAADPAVLQDPAPSAFIGGVEDGKATISAYAWVANGDWLGTRDTLWATIALTMAPDAEVALALPQLAMNMKS